jgi:hypothetical protein
MRAAIVVACVLAGCWSTTSPAPTPPPTCTAVADHVATLLAPGPGTRDAILTRCTADHWADDVLRCMLAETAGDRRHCKQQLTPAQRTALATELATARTPALSTACDQFARTMLSLASCDQLPRGMRELYDMQRQMLLQRGMVQAMPPDARDSFCRMQLSQIDPDVIEMCVH